MGDEICNVSQNLARFADGVGASTRVIAVYEMGVLGLTTQVRCGSADPLASTALAGDANRYLHVPARVGSTNALEVLLAQYPVYAPFLRPDAALHIVVITDDESDLPAATFSASMAALHPRPYSVHAIAGISPAESCDIAEVGNEYLSIAASTGGQALSICAPDYSMLFDALEDAVRSTTSPCEFELPSPPTGQTLDVDAVQVLLTPAGTAARELPRTDALAACSTNEAWGYVAGATPARVALCPSACDTLRLGGDLSIRFGCAPQVLR
jgi:hypothetical protein